VDHQGISKRFQVEAGISGQRECRQRPFLRAPHLQLSDYLVAGPYKQLKKYKPQDWNKIEVTVKDNVAHCVCNGEVLEKGLTLPPTGPIGLEGDRGQMEYRHIQVKEMP